VDPRDLAGFADAVVELIDDAPTARAMGSAAREQVRELFLGPRHLRHYVDLFEELLTR
jgi:glycosyltransferase involved in cell wall biosynthesis